MKIQLINVGRQNINKEINVNSADEALAEVSKHLMSSDITLIENKDIKDFYDVVVGGLRTVGQIKIIDRQPKKVYYSARNLPKHIIKHSPTGMNWGYMGSGPSDLALSLLTEVIGSKGAEKYYIKFKKDIVSKFKDGWFITTEKIQDWYIDNLIK